MRKILDAARLCFRRDGFHKASTAEISRTAGVSIANLYQYFPSKDDLIIAIVEEDHSIDLGLIAEIERSDSLVEGMADAIASALASPSMINSVQLHTEILAEAARNPRVAAILKRTEDEVATAVAAVVAAGQKTGQITVKLEPAQLTELLLSFIQFLFDRSVLLAGAAAPTRDSVHAQLRHILDPSR